MVKNIIYVVIGLTVTTLLLLNILYQRYSHEELIAYGSKQFYRGWESARSQFYENSYEIRKKIYWDEYCESILQGIFEHIPKDSIYVSPIQTDSSWRVLIYGGDIRYYYKVKGDSTF